METLSEILQNPTVQKALVAAVVALLGLVVALIDSLRDAVNGIEASDSKVAKEGVKMFTGKKFWSKIAINTLRKLAERKFKTKRR